MSLPGYSSDNHFDIVLHGLSLILALVQVYVTDSRETSVGGDSCLLVLLLDTQNDLGILWG